MAPCQDDVPFAALLYLTVGDELAHTKNIPTENHRTGAAAIHKDIFYTFCLLLNILAY